MQIQLEQLQHQEDALSSILNFMGEDALDTNSSRKDFNYVFANPYIRPDLKNIDIKMETGTGKTYVYTRMMFELNKRYGLNKFIIAVPSLAIKEGTKNFIKSEYAKRHFSKMFGGKKVILHLVNAGDFATKKGSRKQISGSVLEFCESTRSDVNSIHCLLINQAMIISSSMSNNDYDTSVIGGVSCPNDAIKLTRPIVIIDEPHRFQREGRYYTKMMEAYAPQMVVRFGATFPEKKARGLTEKDYINKVYDLGAVDAFNQDLVKGISVEYSSVGDDAQSSEKIKLVRANSKEAEFLRMNDKKTFTLREGASLSELYGDLAGIDLEKCTNKSVFLSNGHELEVNGLLDANVCSQNYQELMMKQAIDAHFEHEQENFLLENNAPKIKTLSLYFIDSIRSYRGEKGSGSGWLRKAFEKMLTEKMEELIKVYENSEDKREKEYCDFLKASLLDIHGTNGGYFAEDSNAKKSEDKIAEEVDDILRNKEKLLQFKNKDGSWNVRRFLFSKWTLKEGWDNPNVFVICKMRTSGSENSKLQEVGRGLRLPVDESGRRLSGEKFWLTYIVDYSEKDFAEKIKKEANSDSGVDEGEKITDEILERLVVIGYGENKAKAKGKLALDDIIDENDIVINLAKLQELLPETKVKKGKIRVRGEGKPMLKLRKKNFNKILDLWQNVSKRYMLEFEKLDKKELQKIVDASFASENFVVESVRFSRTRLNADEDGLYTERAAGEVVDLDVSFGLIEFKDFVKRLHKETSLDIGLIVSGINDAIGGNKDRDKLLNHSSLMNIVNSFRSEFEKVFSQKYDYSSLDFSATTSLYQNGGFVNEIAQGDIGKNEVNIKTPDNYLYDKVFVDSPLEEELASVNSKKVLVFGKLPRRSIKVPTYTGGTSSPDFVYAIKGKDGTSAKLRILVEAKSTNMRGSDKVAVEAQKKVLGQMKDVEWEMVTSKSEIEKVLERF